MMGLDVAAGARTCIKELYGDWYRDPWGWPEFSWVAENASKLKPDDVLRTEKGGGVGLRHPAHFDLTEVPKNSLAVRPAVVMDPLSRLLYAAAAYPQIKKMHSALPDWVYGWRNRDKPGFANNGAEWRDYRTVFDDVAKGQWGLTADITSFFASIDVDRVEESLYQSIGKNASMGVLTDVIQRHNALSTRSGLPQRSWISAAIAHLIMAPMDDVLTRFIENNHGSRVSRWMDDINATGADSDLYALHVELEDRARQIGLELNASKSSLVPIEELREALAVEGKTHLKVGRRAAAEYGVEDLDESDDSNELLEAEDAILDEPTDRPKWELKSVLIALRQGKHFDGIEEWMDVAHYIPHAADDLSRYLREGYIEDPSVFSVADWFIEIMGTKWSTLNWVSAQWALGVPHSDMSARYLDKMADWLASSLDPQQLAIAGQRLAAARPAACRDIVRARVDRVQSPLLLRILALTLLAARDDRRQVRSILTRDPQNLLLLSALEDQGWSPPSVSSDFDDEPSDEVGP